MSCNLRIGFVIKLLESSIDPGRQDIHKTAACTLDRFIVAKLIHDVPTWLKLRHLDGEVFENEV